MTPRSKTTARMFFLSVAALLFVTASAGAQGVLTVAPGRTASTIAGTGTASFSGDSGAGTSATLFNPGGAVYDGAGDLYISDTQNNRVRKIAVGGTITTVAGTGTQGFSGDNGAATSATLDQPMGLALDSVGNLYIADSHNHAIRKVTGTTITTVAGTGTAGFSGDNGAAISAMLDQPEGVVVDGSGNIYIADTLNQRIRKVTGGTISTISGTGHEAYAGDGSAATLASLDMPAGLALDVSGNLYIADSHNQTVREIATSGVITTIAGNGTNGFSGDNGTAATAAMLALPMSVATDNLGNVYVADSSNNRVREIGNGGITTVAGTGNGPYNGDTGDPTTVALDTPRAVALSATRNLAVGDTLNQRQRVMLLPNLNFGTVSPNSVSSAQTITLTNTGTGALTLTAINLPGGFTKTGGNCAPVPAVLQASGNCTVQISFAPTAAQTYTGQASFAYTTGSVAQPSPLIQVLGSATSVLSVSVIGQNAVYATPTVSLEFMVSYAAVGAPTGTPALTVDGSTTNVGTMTCTAKALHNTCFVSYNTSTLSPGAHTISVTQPSDSNYPASATGTATLTITGGPGPGVVTGGPVKGGLESLAPAMVIRPITGVQPEPVTHPALVRVPVLAGGGAAVASAPVISDDAAPACDKTDEACKAAAGK